MSARKLAANLPLSPLENKEFSKTRRREQPFASPDFSVSLERELP
jgi:hypothetical protein